jgi:hypothetical protein
MTTEITLFSRHTTLAVVGEAISLETKILAAESEEALAVVEALVLGEVPVVGVVLAVPIMLLKVEFTTSSSDMRHFLAFPTTFEMSI